MVFMFEKRKKKEKMMMKCEVNGTKMGFSFDGDLYAFCELKVSPLLRAKYTMLSWKC